jgi:hypothetical protein
MRRSYAAYAAALRRHLGVDPGIRDDFGITLRDQSEDQHPGAVLGVVQALREELPHRLRMRAVMRRGAHGGGDARRNNRNNNLKVALMRSKDLLPQEPTNPRKKFRE